MYYLSIWSYSKADCDQTAHLAALTLRASSFFVVTIVVGMRAFVAYNQGNHGYRLSQTHVVSWNHIKILTINVISIDLAAHKTTVKYKLYTKW